MHRSYAHLDARTLSYFDSAPDDRAAKVCVLVHAFPLGAGMWEPQFKAVPAGWRLIAPDLRGFGGSTITEPDDNTTMEEYAADVSDLLAQLEIGSAVIGGLSLGGYVTLALLRRSSELARGVILADTRATADTSQGRANRRAMLALIEREGAAGVAREMMPQLLGRTTLSERSEVEPVVRRLVKGQSPAALRGAVQRMMQRSDTFDVLASLTVPILVIVGDEDTLTPSDDSRKMAAANSKAELVVIPRAGHLASLEQPEPFNAAVAAFLSRLT